MSKCTICGGEESDHHPFTPVKKPEGCICNEKEWGTPVLPPVCKKYYHNPDANGNCRMCEHDYECHQEYRDAQAIKEHEHLLDLLNKQAQQLPPPNQG